MLSAAEIKFIKSLSQKKFRDSSGLFVAEGEKLVAEALASRFEVEKVFRKDEIGEAAMARITGLSSPSPALALVHRPKDFSKAELPAKGLFLALDEKADFLDELTGHNTSTTPRWIFSFVWFMVRWVAPIIIIVIMLSNILL